MKDPSKQFNPWQPRKHFWRRTPTSVLFQIQAENYRNNCANYPKLVTQQKKVDEFLLHRPNPTNGLQEKHFRWKFFLFVKLISRYLEKQHFLVCTTYFVDPVNCKYLNGKYLNWCWMDKILSIVSKTLAANVRWISLQEFKNWNACFNVVAQIIYILRNQVRKRPLEQLLNFEEEKQMIKICLSFF